MPRPVALKLGERREAELVLESRYHADALDRRLIESAVRSGWAPAVRYTFGQPHEECPRWLADVVAGAVAAAIGDGHPTYLGEIAPQVNHVACP